MEVKDRNGDFAVTGDASGGMSGLSCVRQPAGLPHDRDRIVV
jgi:hypothetical protein